MDRRPAELGGTVEAHFTVSLSADSTETITVDYATADSAGSNYQAISGTLTFAPGETSKIITRRRSRNKV